MTRYFSEWFPYYAVLGRVPEGIPVSLWPAWGWRFFVTATVLVVLAALARVQDRAP